VKPSASKVISTPHVCGTTVDAGGRRRDGFAGHVRGGVPRGEPHPAPDQRRHHDTRRRDEHAASRPAPLLGEGAVHDLLAELRGRGGGGVETVGIDAAQPGDHRLDLGDRGLALRAAVEVGFQRRALRLAELAQHVGAERLAERAVLVAVHGSTLISSMASRCAFNP